MSAPTRRNLLRASAALASGALLRPTWARAVARPKHLVVVLADGGWDTTYALDPKVGNDAIDGPDAGTPSADPLDVEAIQTFAEIPILCNAYKRPAVTAFFERWAPRTAVINGLWTESIVHRESRIRVLTGTKLPTSPDAATIIGHLHGADLPLGTINFGGRGFTGPLAASAGRVGTTSQLRTLVDPASAFPAPADADYALPTFGLSGDQSDAVSAHLARRLEAFRTQRADGAYNDQSIANLEESHLRKARLVREGASILSDLRPGYAPDLALQAPLAVDLLANGLCQTVTLTLDGWDTHALNGEQHLLHDSLFTTLDGIAQALTDYGLFEDTLVAVLSEIGRTPKINGAAGKDHWPHTSAMLLGGGVRGGRVYGATDDALESVPVDLESGDPSTAGSVLRYDSFVAGLLAGLDVDPEEWLPGVEVYRGPMA